MYEAVPNRTARLVLWTIWASSFFMVLTLQFDLGGGIPQGRDIQPSWYEPVFWIAMMLLGGATIMRWWLLPRVRGYRPVLLGLIIGVALTEGAAILGLFLLPDDMPATQAAVFFLSLFSFMQLAPYYARRLGEEGKRGRAEGLKD